MPTILIIEDSQFSRKRIAGMLDKQKFEILEAANGADGLNVLEDREPDCVLCDLLMPEMDGYGLLKGVRERNLLLPVLIVTADIQETTKRRVLELGAAGVIHKPLSKADLNAMIDQALAVRKGAV